MLDKKMLENIEKALLSTKTKTIKTGFQDLNYFLKGIDSSALITIGARPSMGKTAFLITLLINFLRQKKKCLFLSLEMSVKTIVTRMISQITEISTIHLREGNFDKNNIEKIHWAISEIADFDLTLTYGISDINSITEQIENQKPDFVFIDYIQLIYSNSKQSRAEVLSDILRKLKKTAKDNDCIIFISSQLSRSKLADGSDRRPKISDLKENKNISDVIIFLYREEYYDNENPEYKNKGELTIVKNNFGICGRIELQFNRKCSKWKDI